MGVERREKERRRERTMREEAIVEGGRNCRVILRWELNFLMGGMSVTN